MINSGIIESINNNKLTVSIYKESACSHCNKCGDNAKIANKIMISYDKTDVNIGDIITFEMEDSQIFKAALIVYILPLIFMFLGYYLVSKSGFNEGVAVISSFLSLFFSFIGIFFYDRKIVKKKIENSIDIISIKKRGN